MKNLDEMIDNRIRIARRWHRLKKPNDILGFVKGAIDEEVAADPDLSEALCNSMIKDIITADKVRLRELRRMLGRTLVDKVRSIARTVNALLANQRQ